MGASTILGKMLECLKGGIIDTAMICSTWGKLTQHLCDKLSTYMWKLREMNVEPTISWSKVCPAKTYKLGSKVCSLCLAEKTEIARDTSGEMLNKRSELMHKCMHRDKFKLANFCSAQQIPVPLNPLQSIVDDQCIHDDPEPGEDNGEPPDGDVNHDGPDEPPDLDGILASNLYENPDVRKSSRNTKRKHASQNEENLSNI